MYNIGSLFSLCSSVVRRKPGRWMMERATGKWIGQHIFTQSTLQSHRTKTRTYARSIQALWNARIGTSNSSAHHQSSNFAILHKMLVILHIETERFSNEWSKCQMFQCNYQCFQAKMDIGWWLQNGSVSALFLVLWKNRISTFNSTE